MELNSRFLRDMLEGKYNIKNSPDKAETMSSDENSNGGGSEDLSLESLSDYPNKYYFVVLDYEVEDILQKVDDELFNACFPLDKIMVRCLLMELHKITHHPMGVGVGHSRRLSFDMSVLVTLSYLMHGNLDALMLLKVFKDYSGENLQRCVEKMCQIFVHFLSPVYVNFPCSQEEQEKNKSAFVSRFGVPGVIGVLECFHIPLLNVPQDEMHMYRHRRNPIPTIATQLICDQNYRFLDVNPRFSGVTYNTHIWKNSHIKDIIQHAQKRNPHTWLVADRGYYLTSGVINPYRNPTDMLQESVNVALKEIQKVILKAFAMLRARFRCMNTALPLTHLNAMNVIISCVTLHNYLLAKEQPIEENLHYQMPKEVNLPNAHCEDVFSSKGMGNRELIKDYMYNHSMQVLYKMRKNSNLSFVSFDNDQMSTSQLRID